MVVFWQCSRNYHKAQADRLSKFITSPLTFNLQTFDMSSKGLPVLLGTANLGSPKDPDARINTVPLAQEIANVYRKHGGTTIDTARIYPPGAYGTAEEFLGETDVASWAVLDTKVDSNPGNHTAEKIAASIKASLNALKVKKVNLLYLHYPERTNNLEVPVAAMAEAYKKGYMNNWAISNYSIDEVKQIVAICKKNGYRMPVAYQGHYSALSRKMEDDLLPLLREHSIAFYAYSPGAGGAFSTSSRRKNDQVSLFVQLKSSKCDLKTLTQ
jgi:aflatoxin B1 aldehyde reductase